MASLPWLRGSELGHGGSWQMITTASVRSGLRRWSSPAQRARALATLFRNQGRPRLLEQRSPCIFATLAKSYRDFSLEYTVHENPGEDGQSSNVEIPHGLHHYGMPQNAQNPFLPPDHATTAHQALQHHHGHQHHNTLVHLTTSPENHTNLYPTFPIRQMAQQHQPQTPYVSPTQAYPYPPRGRKRSPPREELHLELQYGLHSPEEPVTMTPHNQHAPFYSAPPHPAQPQLQTHHHHRLPNQGPPHKLHRGVFGELSPPSTSHGPPSVVGQEGMPPPAPRPRGPKLKFTPEDDQLLVDLKEKKNLTWKQIAEFFPGRSSGTLQVRYCTKLKAKTTVWTDDMIQKLRNAMQEYDNDKWRIISSKVGSGFSPAACRDKAAELAGEVPTAEDELESITQDADETGPATFGQEVIGLASSSDQPVTFQ
ncbi:hypothetical protein HDK77DRAFT_480992 [Phyllosticta capitalensis]